MPGKHVAPCVVIAWALFAAPLVWAQDAKPDDKPFTRPPAEFNCRFTELPIEIDGLAKDAAWETAEVIDAFHLPWLGAKARGSRTATKASPRWKIATYMPM